MTDGGTRVTAATLNRVTFSGAEENGIRVSPPTNDEKNHARQANEG
jgi:hypothetical protein